MNIYDKFMENVTTADNSLNDTCQNDNSLNENCQNDNSHNYFLNIYSDKKRYFQ